MKIPDVAIPLRSPDQPDHPVVCLVCSGSTDLMLASHVLNVLFVFNDFLMEPGHLMSALPFASMKPRPGTAEPGSRTMEPDPGSVEPRPGARSFCRAR